MRNNSEEEMSLKDSSYLELRQPLCSVERNHMCNVGRRHHEEHFYEVILNFDQWYRRCRLGIFLIRSSGCPFAQWSEAICAFLIKDIMRNNSVKLFEFGQWFRRNDNKRHFLSRALAAPLFGGAEPFVQFWYKASLGTFL